MAILMIWPLLVSGLLCLYVRHLQLRVNRRNERITRASVDAVQRNIQFQRELFEASR